MLLSLVARLVGRRCQSSTPIPDKPKQKKPPMIVLRAVPRKLSVKEAKKLADKFIVDGFFGSLWKGLGTFVIQPNLAMKRRKIVNLGREIVDPKYALPVKMKNVHRLFSVAVLNQSPYVRAMATVVLMIKSIRKYTAVYLQRVARSKSSFAVRMQALNLLDMADPNLTMVSNDFRNVLLFSRAASQATHMGKLFLGGMYLYGAVNDKALAASVLVNQMYGGAKTRLDGRTAGSLYANVLVNVGKSSDKDFLTVVGSVLSIDRGLHGTLEALRMSSLICMQSRNPSMAKRNTTMRLVKITSSALSSKPNSRSGKVSSFTLRRLWLHSPDQRLQIGAVVALGIMRDRHAEGNLIWILRNSNDAMLRKAALWSLKRINPRAVRKYTDSIRYI